MRWNVKSRIELLLMLIIGCWLLSCKGKKASDSTPDNDKDLVAELIKQLEAEVPCEIDEGVTYVPYLTSTARRDFYQLNKKRKLDIRVRELRQSSGGTGSEADSLDIDNIQAFQVLLNNIASVDPNKKIGMRVYIGTRLDEETERKNGNRKEDLLNAGKMIFIFNPTKPNKRDYDDFHYYVFSEDKKEFEILPKATVKMWVKNYQKESKKRNWLFETLSGDDAAKRRYETKHIYFSHEKLTQIKKNVECLGRGIVKGAKVRLVSYRDVTSEPNSSGGIPLRKRLTVDFQYIKANGRPLTEDDPVMKSMLLLAALKNKDARARIEKISVNLANFREAKTQDKLNLLHNNKEVQAIIKQRNASDDTGDPSPPPAGEKEELDDQS